MLRNLSDNPTEAGKGSLKSQIGSQPNLEEMSITSSTHEDEVPTLEEREHKG